MPSTATSTTNGQRISLSVQNTPSAWRKPTCTAGILSHSREVHMSRTIVAFYAPSGRVYSRVAWTGGDTPTPEIRRNADYRYLRRMLFREQVRECGGLDLWAFAGTSALER